MRAIIEAAVRWLREQGVVVEVSVIYNGGQKIVCLVLRNVDPRAFDGE